MGDSRSKGGRIRVRLVVLFAIVPPALVALTLYLATMPPTITWWFGGSDSGDLVPAADLLGVPHPTGYPLFVIIGHLATRVPVGEVAARINAMNAVLAAGGAALTGLTVYALRAEHGRHSRIGYGAVGLAALALATAGLYWSQAIIGEVYALHAALTALLLWLWARGSTPPVLLGAAHGLAMTNHLTSALFVGAAVLVMLFGRNGGWNRGALLWFGLGAAMPLLLYLLLPLRAAQDPMANWGDPSTPGRLLAHVTGREYAGLVSVRDPAGMVRDLLGLLRLMIGDLPPWVIPSAVLGLKDLWSRQRQFAVVSSAIAASVLVFSAMYQTADRAPYILPAYVVVCVWAGTGLVMAGVWAAERWQDGRSSLIAAGALAAVALLSVWAVRAGRRVNLHGDDSAVVFAQITLDALPPGATYYSARDDVTFALWYAQRSLGVRRDVLVVDLRGAGAGGEP
jgi:hypothetical protein